MGKTAEEGLTLSERLAEHISATEIGDLPPAAIEKARLCILDTLGCMLAGSRDRVATIVAAHAVAHGPGGRSTIVGRGERVDAASAGMANGTAAHVLDWDDGHRPSGDHLGAPVISTALAMAEETGASGAGLLLAVVLGYDAMGRVGEAVCLPRGERYFHGNGVNGAIGAAAVAGKLLGLDCARLASAIAVAADGASGLRQWAPTGADVKSLHVGRACYTGITSAYLAAAGLQGSRTVFEGRSGFLGAISPQPRPERVVMELGERFSILEAGFKLYPCVGTLHLPIEAALRIRAEHAPSPASIERIRIGVPDWARGEYADRQRPPETVGNARFSMSFTVAAALVDGEVTPRQFTRSKLDDPGIASLEARTSFVHDDEVEAIFREQRMDESFFFIPCVVEVDSGGNTYRKLVRTPIGYDPLGRGLDEAQVVAKFHSAAEGTIAADDAERTVAWVLGLGRGSTIEDFGKMAIGRVA